jgi:hypothetical protein
VPPCELSQSPAWADQSMLRASRCAKMPMFNESCIVRHTHERKARAENGCEPTARNCAVRGQPCPDDGSALAFRRLQSSSDGVITIDDSFHSTKRSRNDAGPDDGEAPVIVSLVEAAMQMFSAAIDALPNTSDPEFSGRANVILSGLRKLQTALTKAASRGRATPSVIVSLSGVRTRYDDLMMLASEAPGATLGQQLYVVRRRSKLSALETANGAGLTPELLDAIEAEEIPTDDEAARIKELLAALGG